ncbi:hypothetical protein DY000_02018167 [Brassica cretica]|uniref:Uncharacterized protein n=1 Tax=Brassica cretica TaxID=69181 RepID=A0ABQ7DAM8_BRACR|nr:hypothetical protein DY000_02018167 [Brassica cretica]
MKNGEMKQSKKLLEDIAGIAENCLTVCPSQEGGILRQCAQESPLANGQIFIDGQVQCDIKVLLQHEGFTRIVSKVCSAKCLAGWQVLLEIMAVQKVFKAEVV